MINYFSELCYMLTRNYLIANRNVMSSELGLSVWKNIKFKLIHNAGFLVPFVCVKDNF